MKGLNCHRGRNPVCDISAHDPGPELDTYTLCLTDSQLYPHGETEETGKQDHWPQDNKKRTEPKPRAKELLGKMADDVDQQQTTNTVEEPLDLIRLSLDERIY
ncbi:hypothetical protein MG293_011476 [Ovis ammon polii]|uniref:Uncharacterized protein n=1 Tax=Ovis ammon polii TaxID=230172 RepID=A0AAD4U233_OVIAM|nr:hypothetical protein MG293_011476 [Ovis ammon polii]